MKNLRLYKQSVSDVILSALITFLCSFSLIAPLAASSTGTTGCVKIAWDPNPESDVIGYRVHYGTQRGAYTKVIDIGSATEFDIPGLIKDQTYFCTVTAYNTHGITSDFSDELQVIYTPFVSRPPTKEFRIDRIAFGANQLMTFEVSGMIGNTVEVWASPNLANWIRIGTLTGVSSPITIRDTAAKGQPKRFYQLRTP